MSENLIPGDAPIFEYRKKEKRTTKKLTKNQVIKPNKKTKNNGEIIDKAYNA